MKHHIFIDFERMKYPHTGLYHFSRQLGAALASQQQADELFHFYMPAKLAGLFGDHVKYIAQQSFHKLLLPSPSRFQVWHATQQGTEYYPTASRVKKVLTIHDINFMYDEKKSAEKKKKYLDKLKQKVNRADCITAVSAFALQDVQQHIDLSGKMVQVIYNGCNIGKEGNMPAQAAAFTPSSPFLFTIGTITDKKNFHVLPALLAGNDFQLVIAGVTQSEAYKAQIEAEAAKHGVKDRVHFTGPVSENDKLWYLQQCSAFVFPSLAEGFGLPVIEAMYFGKPVFLSQLTSLPEIGGDAAYYFSSFEKEAMQQTLEKGLQHFHTHPEAAMNIRRQAGKFSWDNAASEYRKVYQQLW